MLDPLARSASGPAKARSAVASIPAGLLVLFPFLVGRPFETMYRDFGGERPLVTRIAVSTWCPLALAALTLAWVVYGSTRAPAHRRQHTRAALAFGALALAALIAALYLPILHLASTIRPD